MIIKQGSFNSLDKTSYYLRILSKKEKGNAREIVKDHYIVLFRSILK